MAKHPSWQDFNSANNNPVNTEERELHNLYSLAQNLFQATPLAAPAARDHICDLVLQQLSSSAVPSSIATTLKPAVAGCMSMEPLLFAPPQPVAPDDITSFKAIARKHKNLKTQISHLQEFDKRFAFWWQNLNQMLSPLIRQIPVGAPVSASTLVLSHTLISQLCDGKQTIDGIVSVLASKQLSDVRFFRLLYTRLRENTLRHYGFSLADLEANNPAALACRHGQLITDLGITQAANVLFARTPLLALFNTPIHFPIPNQTRFEHCHILAGTGHGKTQLLQQLIWSDLSQPADQVPGLVIMDSHGALVKAVQQLDIFNLTKGSQLGRRVLIVDPADVAFTPQLNLFSRNILEQLRPDTLEYEQHINTVAQTFTFIFSGLMGHELTTPQSTAFGYLAELMATIPDATITTLLQVLADPESFLDDFERLPNPVARDYFMHTFMSKRFLSQTGEAIRNRLLAITRNRSFQRMFGAKQNRLNLFNFLNDGGILLVNTNKNFLQPDVSAIFGRFIIAMTFQAVMRRAALPPAQRRATFLYIDEAHEYFDKTFNALLTQARQYNLGVVLAHQHLAQIPKDLEGAIMGSTSIKFAGGLRFEKDRKIMATEMNCDTAFLQSCIKDPARSPKFSDFAAHAANHTTTPARYRVEFGRLTNQSQMSNDDFEILLNDSRFKLSGIRDPDANLSSTPSSPPPDPPQPTSTTADIPRDVDDEVYHDIAGDLWDT